VIRLAVVTAGRSDFGIFSPLLRKLEADGGFEVLIIATGMHVSPEFGTTVKEIGDRGFRVERTVEMNLSSDSEIGVSKSIGVGVLSLADTFAELAPDLLLVLGDRFEMLAATVAALPLRIPIAHIGGGDLTEGAIDDSIRHAITKMSHLHFATNEESANRILQMGEEPWRVHHVGNPGLDGLAEEGLSTPEEIEAALGFAMNPPPLLVTFHPVTLELESVDCQVLALLEALDQSAERIVFTMPNADAGGRKVGRVLQDWIDRRSERATMVASIGRELYFSLMHHARAMVGNSSSGVVEAASFGLPTVNIGTRQRGRLRSENVIDVGNRASEIADGIGKALTPEFRAVAKKATNPYGDGKACERILSVLWSLPERERLLRKRFIRLTQEGAG